MNKGIDLGLESLLTPKVSSEGFMSTEYLQNVMEFFESCSDLQASIRELGEMTSAYASLCSISSTIKKYGVTPSIEALYGENFNSVASMEEETEKGKESILQRIIAFFARLIEKLKNWWAKFRGIVEKAKAAAKEAKFSKKFKFNGIDVGPDIYAGKWVGDVKDGFYETEADPEPRRLDTKEIEVEDEEQFNKLKQVYIDNIDRIASAQKEIDAKLKETVEKLKQKDDEELRKNKAKYDRRLLAFTTNTRKIAYSLLALVAANNRAAKMSDDNDK